MGIEFSAEIAQIVARAFTTGVETSVERLAELLDVSTGGRLAAAVAVLDFVEQLHLELVPGPLEGEFGSIRVLRAAASPDPAARLKVLLDAGEGPEVEFKSSMFSSMHEWKKKSQLVEHPSLQGELLKTICAFLNTDGGDLLVGVDDEGNPCGGLALDMQLKGWTLDKWQLHFQSLVKERFHEGYNVQPYLRTTIVQMNSVDIFHVSVMARAARSFVQRDKAKSHEFFIRNGPRSDSLDLPGFYGHLLGTGRP